MSTSIPHDGENGVDVAAWTRTREDGVKETLVLAAQLFYSPPGGAIEFELHGVGGNVKRVCLSRFVLVLGLLGPQDSSSLGLSELLNLVRGMVGVL